MSSECHQKQVGINTNKTQCRSVSQKAIPASTIIFHQAKKQFAALKLENKSSSAPGEKIVTDAKIGIKSIGITPIQGLPCLQNKIPILKISPSLNTIIPPKYDQRSAIKTKTPSKIVVPRARICNSETKKVITNGTIVKTPKLARVKATVTSISNQQKQNVSQHTPSSSGKYLAKMSTPAALRTKSNASCVSSGTIPLRSPIQQRSEAKKADTQQETQKKQPGAIKVISVNTLNTRQSKNVTENIPKPLRLAPSLSKANIMPKVNQSSPAHNKLPSHKPFTAVTNIMSHEKYEKPVFFVTSNANNRSNQTKKV